MDEQPIDPAAATAAGADAAAPAAAIPDDVVPLDTRLMKALTNPVRVRVLAEVRRLSSVTATTVAARIGISSGLASYHLRRLAEFGFIEPDAEREAQGREKWWRPSHRGTSVDHALLAAQGPEVSGAFVDAVAGLYAGEILRGARAITLDDPVWGPVYTLSDDLVALTADQADALGREIRDAVERYRLVGLASLEADPDASRRPLHVQWQILPGDPHDPGLAAPGGAD